MSEEKNNDVMYLEKVWNDLGIIMLRYEPEFYANDVRVFKSLVQNLREFQSIIRKIELEKPE